MRHPIWTEQETGRETPNGMCECADAGCPGHKGKNRCHYPVAHVMFRVDMEDKTGTAMCEGCATDAFESGLFESDENWSEEGGAL
jgi:hypothetical protein